MAGTSSYFGKSKSTVDVAAKSFVRRYKTRKQPIKIEYETTNVASASKVEENYCTKEEKTESQTTTTNKTPCVGIENNEAHVNINMKEEIKNELTVKSEYCEENNETHNINIKEEIIKNELVVKRENCDNYTWEPENNKACNLNIKHKEELLKSEFIVKSENWVPKNWEIVLHNIKEMRKYRTAVVDTLGCERLSDLWESPEVIRFQTLTSLLLSSQTKDQVTSAAVGRLKKHGLNIPNIIKTPDHKLGKLIHPVGFWKKKAEYLKRCAVICQESYHGDIPSTLKGLKSLPGIGPKMAHICMNVAWGEVSGIGVDTHVHRIANRLGWVRKPTKVPDHTRKELESWLPKNEWNDINILLVGFGQEICKSVGPNCQSCLNNDICPSDDNTVKNEKKKKKKKNKKQKVNKKMKVEE